MQLGLSENLSALVARRFTTAKEAGHLVFSSTHLSIIHAAGIPYQLRYCPALAKKPSNLQQQQPSPAGPKPPKPDPFQDPSPDLLIAQFPAEKPAYSLVLNKFPVIPNHFILATVDWQAQTDLLVREDLEATYECLRAWGVDESFHEGSNGSSTSSSFPSPKNPKKKLFAFFNSGDDSGASQPHRHLQFLPVEAMRAQPSSEKEPTSPNPAWDPLIETLSTTSSTSQSSFQSLSQLPFAHFALPLPPNPSPETLHTIYLRLYRAAVAATHGQTADQYPENIPTEGPAVISYNLAMTLSTMLICPRRQETARVPVDAAAASEKILDSGVLSLNGTLLAGTLMVKAESEWDALRRNPGLLTGVLADVGHPRWDRWDVSSLG
ncbi:ATP adenylyltransferase C-terminal [Penicillium alfredii]|uniref:ATP adenylyltransferase C-terminal n=1 Tax=Penicillium alfredii TaxID=1506179 RepID=A0A9W9GAN1_9EURO|nr:ATP adenylyltransferase C-terminal [Penicillium alfredii]KAJ5114500.1 ATP adenylyltransferase C-terminal [Penicillium alfredii]